MDEVTKLAISQLDEDKKLKLMARLLGYREMPVDIETFVKSPYYLGNSFGSDLFPAWLEELKDLFPDPIRVKYLIVVLTGAIGCISGDTKIKLLNGRILTIKELYEKCPEGGFHVYSWDIENGFWMPGFVSGVYYTGVKRVVKVRLKDWKGNITERVTTPDHKYLLTSGKYVEAKDLKEVDSIQSLYFTDNCRGPYKSPDEYGSGREFIHSHKSHDVISVEILKDEIPVYDMTVENYHNYGICDSDSGLIFTHNTGKSTFSKIAALYTEYKLNCMENPHKSFGLADTKGIQILWFHVSNEKAQRDFVDSIKLIKKKSPYWCRIAKEGKPHKIEHVIDGVRTNNSIGADILYYNLSELSFVPRDKAKYKLEQACVRFKSRFQLAIGYSGNIVIDSSARENTSIVDEFIRNNPFSSQGLVKIVRMSIWRAKAHLGEFFKKGAFYVYLGDSIRKPFIIPDDFNRTELDSERIIKVPEELRSDFELNIVGALQDQAGISTNNTGRWLQDVDKIKECFCEPINYPETIKVDFYDLDDNIMDRLRDTIITSIPREKICFIRFDLGLTRDRAGLAIGYFDEYEILEDEISGTIIKIPSYRAPVLAQISRKSGQETSLTHIFKFIKDFNMLREIGNVSFDQFASAQIIQDCKRAKIPVSRISVDRTAIPYDYLKRVILQRKVHGAANTLLHKELSGLRYIKGKVDHQPGGITKPDSQIPGKDIADALAGLIWDIYQNLKIATQVSNITAADYQNELMNSLVNDNSQAAINELLKSMW